MIPKFRIFDKQKKQIVESAWWEFYFEDERLLTVTSDSGVSYHDYELGEVWELMQSTGLHDKNGKEIFEGDVVKGKSDSFRLSCYGEVYWDEEFCRWRINDKKRNRQYEVDWRWKLQIIGNIHEHPELLIQPNE